MASETPSTESRKSVRIGKYEILKHVATGGMGAVYRARDTEEDREVALKVLTPDMAAKPAMLVRFQREARNAAKLKHENIVSIYEFGESNGTYYIAMEFVDGIDLHEFITKKKGLSPKDTLKIMIQATRALEHAHANNIIHRDIKPSNFLLTRKNSQLVVKLTDLGLAREVQTEEFRVTRAGTTVGTVDYIAPEQARDSGKADIRSDLYSLGCTWFHMLTGQPPFPEGGLAERLCKHMMDAPPDVRKINPRISRELRAVLNKLLAKDPADRYQDPSELLAALLTLKAGGEREGEAGAGKSESAAELPVDLLEEPTSDVSEEPGLDSSHRDTVAEEKEPRPRSTEIGKPRSGSPRRPPSSSTMVEKKEGRKTKPELESEPEEEPKKKKPKGPSLLLIAGGGSALLLFLVLIVAAITGPTKGKLKIPDQAAATQPAKDPVEPNPPVEKPVEEPTKQPVDKNTPGGKNPSTVKNPSSDPNPPTVKVPPVKPPPAAFPVLYTPAQPPDFPNLLKEIEGPWTKVPALPANAPVLRVVRAPDGQPRTYTTLQAAWDAVPKEGAIIEICDNGPIYDVGASSEGKRIHLRAGKGHRPLLIWDVQQRIDALKKQGKKSESVDFCFLAVDKGGLILEGLEVVLAWPRAVAPGSITLLRATEGDLTVRGCTFSSSLSDPAGKGVTLVRLIGGPRLPVHCRISDSYVRGSTLSVLDSQAHQSEVLLEDSLIVGGQPTLLKVQATDALPSHLRLVRSTLVCGENLLAVRPATPIDQKPALHVLAWDSLLSRSSLKPGGELLQVTGDVSRMKWNAVNCLCTGWETLLSEPKQSRTIAATAVSDWRKLWDRPDGDVVRRETWPATPFHELADKSARAFRTNDAPLVCFASSFNPDKLLGCDLTQLPPTRDNWVALIQERPEPGLEVLLRPDPPVEEMAEGKYAGETLMLSPTNNRGFDLGQHLLKKQQEMPFGPRVVLHLIGTGEYDFSPIRIPRGTSLVIYVDPPEEPKPREQARPLVFNLKREERPRTEALIDLEEGNLEMTNVDLRLPQNDFATDVPAWAIRLRKGNLKLFRCRLIGPQAFIPTTFKGLIACDGSGETSPEKVREIQVSESILLSSQDVVRLIGSGLRLRTHQSLLVAGNNALTLDPGPDARGQANTQLALDRTTLGARQACFFLKELPGQLVPTDPVIVQTRECAFLAPFAGGKPGVLLAQGTAFAQGQLIWQGAGDLLDPHLHYLVASDKAVPEQVQPRGAWSSVWRYPTHKAQTAILDGTSIKYQDEKLRKPWALELFAIPRGTLIGVHDTRAGADPEKLGLIRKRR